MATVKQPSQFSPQELDAESKLGSQTPMMAQRMMAAAIRGQVPMPGSQVVPPVMPGAAVGKPKGKTKSKAKGKRYG